MSIIKDRKVRFDKAITDINAVLDNCFFEAILNGDFFSEPELIENQGDPYININAEFDGYDYENITVEPIIINDYGVMKYRITLKTYSEDNELHYPGYYYCSELKISEKKALSESLRIDRYVLKELEKEPFKIHAHNKNMAIKSELLDRDCYNQVTHTHQYLGKLVILETYTLNDLKPFLQLREFFYGIGG